MAENIEQRHSANDHECQEEWKTKHEEMRGSLWALENNLAIGLAHFQLCKTRYFSWLNEIESGQSEYDPEDEQAFKDKFVWWLEPCASNLKYLRVIEHQYGSAENGKAFEQAFREAMKILNNWTAPSVPSDQIVRADTDTAMTFSQLAEDLDKTTRSVTKSHVALHHEPDPDIVF